MERQMQELGRVPCICSSRDSFEVLQEQFFLDRFQPVRRRLVVCEVT